MLHLSDFREKRFKILIRIFRMNAAEEDVKFHGRCRSTNTNVISQRFSCCHGQIIMSHKRIGGKRCNNYLPSSASPWCWKGLAALDARVFKPAVFLGFLFFFQAPTRWNHHLPSQSMSVQIRQSGEDWKSHIFFPWFCRERLTYFGSKGLQIAMWALGMFNLDLFRCRCADAWGKYKLFIFTPAFLAVSSIIQSKQWCRPQRKHGRVTRHKGVEKQVPVLVLQNSHLHEGEDATHNDISFKCLHKKTHTHTTQMINSSIMRQCDAAPSNRIHPSLRFPCGTISSLARQLQVISRNYGIRKSFFCVCCSTF